MPSRTVAALPRWAWLWFPPVLLLVILPVRLLDPQAYSTWVDGELGLIELLTPVLAGAGAVVGLRLVLAMRRAEAGRALTVWVALVTLACVYFAGEELSWGQHLFGWETPESIGRLNDQRETNLHNVSSWFDQKPRLLLELWVLIGGVIIPLRERATQTRWRTDGLAWWFWPAVECLPCGVLAIAVRLPERIKDVAGLESLPLEIRYSEPQEYYFALFLLLYLAAFRRRFDRAGGRGARSP